MPENKTFKNIAPYLIIAALLMTSSYWFGLFSAIPDRWSAVPTFDSVFFIKLAEQILHLKGFGWLGYHEPFFYPLVIAGLTGITNDLYVSAVLISKISIVLLPPVIFLLTTALFNRKVGVIASVLVLFFPHLRIIAGASQSEAFNVLLVTTSVYLLWQAWVKRSYPLAIGAGLFFAMSYFTRSEGLFVFLLVGGSLLIASRSAIDDSRSLRRVVLVALITFVLIVAPYVGYLSQHYGALTVGTKTSSIYFWVREKCFHDPDPFKTEWGLNSKGELNMISMKSHDLLAYWCKDIPRSISVYLKNFSEQVPGRIPNDGGIKHYPQVFPLYLAIPLVAGLLLLYRRRAPRVPIGYLLSAFLLLFIYPLLTGGWWRYLINLLPFFLILTAVALDELSTTLFRDRRSSILLITAAAAITAYHIWIVAWQAAPPQVVSYQQKKSSIAEETKLAGTWARQIIPAGASYMVQWTRLPYYLRGRWVAMPEAGLDEVLRYARENAVEYLLIESGDASTAAELARLSMPGVAYVGTYSGQAENYYCTLFRLL